MPHPRQPVEPQPSPPPAGAEKSGPGTEAAASPSHRRASELALVVGFLMILAVVPLTQTCLDLARGERVQFTDVFRYPPTASNLRQYEATLKEKSWFQQRVRPEVQRWLFRTFHETGAKAMLGQERWLFYRPDVRYLVEPIRPAPDPGDSKGLPGPQNLSQGDAVVNAIVRFRDQLRERNIALLVLPVPGKPSVYPDQLTRRGADERHEFRSPTLDVARKLQEHGVETLDLFALFGHHRAQSPDEPLYLARDTHWTPLGAKLAAQTVAARLREQGLAPESGLRFQAHAVTIRRWGDVMEMMQIPGARAAFGPELVACEQVLDPALGLLVPSSSERPGTYRYPGRKASVLVLGDSFCRIYQYPEPPSLGDTLAESGPATPRRTDEAGTKRLLPGSAGFVSHLMLALQAPVDAIYSEGGASTDVRRKLSLNPEILEGKKVVIWEFVERDIGLGQAGWAEVPLPRRLD